MKVKDVMKHHLVGLHPDTDLREAARQLTELGISGAPVLNDQGKPIGVISMSDLVAHAAGLDRPKEGPFLPDLQDSSDLLFDEGTTVRNVMTDVVVYMEEEAPLLELVSVVQRSHLHRILVTRDGELTGIITTMDLVACLGRLLERQDAKALA